MRRRIRWFEHGYPDFTEGNEVHPSWRRLVSYTHRPTDDINHTSIVLAEVIRFQGERFLPLNRTSSMVGDGIAEDSWYDFPLIVDRAVRHDTEAAKCQLFEALGILQASRLIEINFVDARYAREVQYDHEAH